MTELISLGALEKAGKLKEATEIINHITELSKFRDNLSKAPSQRMKLQIYGEVSSWNNFNIRLTKSCVARIVDEEIEAQIKELNKLGFTL